MNHSVTSLSDLFDDYDDSTDLYYLSREMPIVTVVDDGHSHGRDHGHGKSTACTIRCTDILEHITSCPVCSKLYKPVDHELYHEQPPIVNKNMVLYGFFVGILLIIILILMKIVIGNK
jgi:hypothetical protein